MEQISSELSRNPSNVGRSSSSSKLHREESKKQLPSEEHQQTENPMSEEGKQFISGATHDEFGHSLEYPPDLPSRNFFYWKNLYPELEYMFDNLEVIREEANNIPQVLSFLCSRQRGDLVRSHCFCNVFVCSGFLGPKTTLLLKERT